MGSKLQRLHGTHERLLQRLHKDASLFHTDGAFRLRLDYFTRMYTREKHDTEKKKTGVNEPEETPSRNLFNHEPESPHTRLLRVCA